MERKHSQPWESMSSFSVWVPVEPGMKYTCDERDDESLEVSLGACFCGELFILKSYVCK